MTIPEIWEFVGSVIRQLLLIPQVRNYFLATTIVVMIYSFFTNHLTIKRLAFYLGLLTLILLGLEIARLNYRIIVDGEREIETLYRPVVFTGYFFFCIWLGIVMGFLCNKILWFTFTDPYGKIATLFEHLAANARARSKANSSEEITSFDELRKVLQDKAASQKLTEESL